MKAIVEHYYVVNDADMDIDHEEVVDKEYVQLEFTIGSTASRGVGVYWCSIVLAKDFDIGITQRYMSGRGYIFVHELTTEIVREILTRLVETINSIEGENWYDIFSQISMYLTPESYDGEFNA